MKVLSDNYLHSLALGIQFEKNHFQIHRLIPEILAFFQETTEKIDEVKILDSGYKATFVVDSLEVQITVAGIVVCKHKPFIRNELKKTFCNEKTGHLKWVAPKDFVPGKLPPEMIDGSAAHIRNDFFEDASAVACSIEMLLSGFPAFKFCGFVDYFLFPYEKLHHNKIFPVSTISADFSIGEQVLRKRYHLKSSNDEKDLSGCEFIVQSIMPDPGKPKEPREGAVCSFDCQIWGKQLAAADLIRELKARRLIIWQNFELEYLEAE